MKSKTQPPPTMKRSWLVQRLNKPHAASGIFGKDNPFAFGGGLRNGGLNDDAMAMLRGIFSFDYMGAAEFEFGAVPEALQGMARDARTLRAFTLDVPLAGVPAGWRAPKGEPAPVGTAKVYVLCRTAHMAEVAERIAEWSRTEYAELKEGLRFTSTLRPYSEYDGETVGWLELDNGFFFFADQPMWEQACSVFGVTP